MEINYYINNGFTLIEILIVVAIIGIGFALSIPNFKELNQRLYIRSTTREIVSKLQLARLKAISSNRNCYVDFDPDNDGNLNKDFYTAYLDIDGSKDANNKTGLDEYRASRFVLGDTLGIIKGTRLPKGIKFASGQTTKACTFRGLRACFNPTGRGSAGSIYISNQDHSQAFKIVVASTGRIRIARWDGSKWIY